MNPQALEIWAYDNPRLFPNYSVFSKISKRSRRNLQALLLKRQSTQFEFTYSGSDRAGANASLSRIGSECSDENWDGFDAAPISLKAISNARKILESIPPYLAVPEVSPQPDGFIGFEWYVSNKFIFEISIGAKPIIYYAGNFHGNKISGREKMGSSLPAEIEINLKRFR